MPHTSTFGWVITTEGGAGQVLVQACTPGPLNTLKLQAESSEKLAVTSLGVPSANKRIPVKTWLVGPSKSPTATTVEPLTSMTSPERTRLPVSGIEENETVISAVK